MNHVQESHENKQIMYKKSPGDKIIKCRDIKCEKWIICKNHVKIKKCKIELCKRLFCRGNN